MIERFTAGLLIPLLLGVSSARAAEPPVAGLLAGLHVRTPSRHENLTIFPLSGGRIGSTSYALLDDAISSGAVKVQEKDGGEVNTVRMRNTGKGYVFGIAGEMVSGARQDRMLQDDVLLPPNSGWIDVPVYCTEHGRWSGTESFGTKRQMVAGRVRERAAMSGSQSEVWAEVDAAHDALGLSAPTKAFARVYDEPKVQQQVEAYEDRLSRIPEVTPGARGALVTVGARVVCVDVFGSPALFRKMWPKLLRSYVIDAVSQHPVGRLSESQARQFIRDAARASLTARPTVGAGALYRIRGRAASGSALIHEARVVHLDLFPMGVDRVDEDGSIPRLQFRRERRSE